MGIHLGDSVLELREQVSTIDAVLEIVTSGGATDSQAVRRPAASIQLMCPIDASARIFGIAQNYPAHAAEQGGPRPPAPVIFVKLASSLAPPDQPVVLPAISAFYDYEGELAAVIGRAGKNISAADALRYVGGYTIVNDGSARDLLNVVLGGKQIIDWYSGKSLDAASPAGPWVVTADEIEDPQQLRIETRLNGEVVQSDVTSSMMFSIAEQIEYVSRRTALKPGDLFATGTPGGVGWAQNRRLAHDDELEIEIERIGVLKNSYVDQEMQP